MPLINRFKAEQGQHRFKDNNTIKLVDIKVKISKLFSGYLVIENQFTYDTVHRNSSICEKN
jgi:hypothetical protein